MHILSMSEKTKKIIATTLAGGTVTVAVFGMLWGVSSLAGMLNSVSIGKDAFEMKRNMPSFSSIKKEVGDKFSSDIEKDSSGNTNILLLGISGDKYISGDLADTIILTSLNEEKNKASLFSIPRDLWVKDPSGNFQKINELYRFAGGTEKPGIKASADMRDKIEEITGQEVHYTAIVNLAGIEYFIDLIDGIETDEGHMNGEEALSYIRDRSRPGGDFDRMKRQQKLIMDVFDKFEEGKVVNTKDSEELMEFTSKLKDYFATDVSLLKMATLGEVVRPLDTKDVGLYTITPDQNDLLYSSYTIINEREIYTLHPSAGKEDYSEIHAFISEILNNRINE